MEKGEAWKKVKHRRSRLLPFVGTSVFVKQGESAFFRKR